MSILLLIGIICEILALLVLATIGIYLYSNYRYPVCPQCGTNLYSKRTKKRVICQIHGEISALPSELVMVW